jgi:hypothetical protein
MTRPYLIRDGTTLRRVLCGMHVATFGASREHLICVLVLIATQHVQDARLQALTEAALCYQQVKPDDRTIARNYSAT